MLDHRAAAAVPSRARTTRLGRRALLTGLLGAAGVAVVGREGVDAPPGGRVLVEAAPQLSWSGTSGAAGARDEASTTVSTATTAEPGPPLLAVLGGLQVHVPATAPVLVAYHEASSVRAQALMPVGRVGDNGNPTRFPAPADDDRGIDYDVQVSRGRAAGPTSAVDVVMEDDAAVLAPLAGTVVGVRDYLLYGRHEDVRIELRPDGEPGLAAVLIHVREPLVAPGQRVDIGTPLAAGARRLPFHSIVDTAVAPRRLGHVHLEVSTPRPEESVQDGSGATTS